MPKRTAKPLVYVPPPPTPGCPGAGKGVWSNTSDIKAINNNPRDALRQAILDALLRLPPQIAETASLRTLPGDMQLDAIAGMGIGGKTPWQKAREWQRNLLVSRWRVLRTRAPGLPRPAEEHRLPRPVVVGTVELHVEKCWRFAPGHQSRDDVMAGILDEFSGELVRELDAVYAHVRTIRARPFPRRNLDRDAMRLVLRTCIGLSDDQIRDYEAGYEVILDGGQVLVRPDGPSEAEDDDAEDDGPIDLEEEKRRSRRERDTVDQSIKNLASDAEIPLPQRRLGKPPDPPPMDDPNMEYLA